MMQVILGLVLILEVLSANVANADDFTAVSSTKFDFADAQIDGKMQAPAGFFLQGKQSQSLSQMVLLRPNFRNELKNSKSEVKALIK